MYSLNKVQVIGNVTADPDVRETPNGAKVATFSVATNRRYTDKSGVTQDQTEFHNIVVWTKLADITESYVKKGHKIYIEGRLQTRSWEDQSGSKRYKTEIVAENLLMLTSKKDAESMEGTDTPVSVSNTPKKSAPEEEISIEDVPF